jgi:hypothetical protein
MLVFMPNTHMCLKRGTRSHGAHPNHIRPHTPIIMQACNYPCRGRALCLIRNVRRWPLCILPHVHSDPPNLSTPSTHSQANLNSDHGKGGLGRRGARESNQWVTMSGTVRGMVRGRRLVRGTGTEPVPRRSRNAPHRYRISAAGLNHVSANGRRSRGAAVGTNML